MTDTEKKIEELLISKDVPYENRNGLFLIDCPGKDTINKIAFAVVCNIGKNAVIDTWGGTSYVIIADKKVYAKNRIRIARDVMNEWAKRVVTVSAKGKKVVLENMRDCVEEAEQAFSQLKEVCDDGDEISLYGFICDEMANKYNSIS